MILSHALDTNGQNARFVEAARKYGRSGTIRALAIGNADPGGVVGRFQEAAEKVEGITIRSAHKVTPYFEFPGDIVWSAQTEPQIRNLVREADVLHLNNSSRPLMSFRMTARNKPYLLHHHGTLFRSNPDYLLGWAKQNRAVQAVSTIDLQRFDPKVLPWLPTAYDVAGLLEFGRQHRREPDGRFLIAHAPTNREGKGTAAFLAAVAELQAAGLPIDVDLIEGVTNAECLERKAQADLLFDQLAWGYGCNAVEAWAMGLPVISGGDDWTLDRMEEQWGYLPFTRVEETTLTYVIRGMYESLSMREDSASRGFEHVSRYHDEKPALETLVNLYCDAIEKRQHHRTRVDPVTFAYSGDRTLRWGGEPVEFEAGTTTTDDPDLIAWLRYLGTRRAYAVEEVA